MTVTVGIGPVSFGDVVAVAREDAQVVLSEEAAAAIHASRDTIEALANDPTPVYGVSTGFGALATRHIPKESRTQLQRSLIRSHAAGSGPEVEREVIRAMMLLRLSTLATGRTGVRRDTAQAYADLISTGLTPVVHEYGSLGCSGDLAPLAHVALSVMGEGYVRTRTGEIKPSAQALAEHGLSPVTLAEKEGLALINGTDGMLGQLVLALADLERPAAAGRRRGRDERRGSARHRPRLRRRPAAAAPAPRPGRGRGQHDPAARGLRRSSPATRPPTARAFRTPTRCGAHPRSRARPATPPRTRAWSPNANSPASSTIPSSPSTVASSPTATSTARPWPTCSTSWRSWWPTWPASASDAPTASSTSTAATASTRSSPTIPASTAAT